MRGMDMPGCAHFVSVTLEAAVPTAASFSATPASQILSVTVTGGWVMLLGLRGGTRPWLHNCLDHVLLLLLLLYLAVCSAG
jgi:hypothetical protein